MKTTFLLWLLRKLNRWRSRIGDVELACKSCNAATCISELEFCECGRMACSECATAGADLMLCLACLEAFHVYVKAEGSQP